MSEAYALKQIALKISSLVKTYRQADRVVQALRGVNMEVTAGEFVAIMGASGSGKSTLLHLCAALDQPDSGTIQIAGETIQSMNQRELTLFRRRRIGVIFQQFNLIPTLNAYENIALPLMLDNKITPRHEEKIIQLLELLQITHRKDHRPDALSGGEQQRVAIARALVTEPPVIFADEPTGNLDSHNAAQFWDLLEQAAQVFEATIVMVTHEPVAAMHSDRVIVLRDGMISGEIPVESVDDAGQLAARYQAMAR